MYRNPKIWKQLLCLILCFALLSVSGAAAEAEDPFRLPEPLPELTFGDVSASAWYYETVRAVCALGLMEGMSGDRFSPNGQVALSQGITVAVRIYEKYRGIDDESQGYEGPWYGYYVDRARDYGILPESLWDQPVSRSATRAELAGILALVLPEEELTPIRQVDTLPDYTEEDPYWDGVLALYRAGVLTGDVSGRFLPDSFIRRSELAAILVRLVRPEYRIVPEENQSTCGMNAFALPDPLPEPPFTDVPSGQWYYPYVRQAYALDLVNGVSGDRFSPNGQVQLSQVTAVAVRIYEKYHGLPDQSQGYGGPWYSYYMDRAGDYGITPESLLTASPAGTATRAELAAILCGALPETELTPLRQVQSLPDYGPKDLYWTQVQTLYEAGVLTGQDDYGTFNPDSPVRRSELATLLTRLVLPSQRTDKELLEKPKMDTETIRYGTSSQGRDLTAYRFGSGKNVMVLTFAIHGWEDSFDRDGQLLVDTAHALRQELTRRYDRLVTAGDWTVYVLPCLNPDGLAEGWTCNGPGRCTIASLDDNGNRVERGVDLNRCFPFRYRSMTGSRNYNGTAPLQAPEAKALADFTRQVKGEGYNVLIDVHGWYRQTIVMGSSQCPIYRTFNKYFPQNDYTLMSDGYGYYSAWASYELGYDVCLFEFPNVTGAAAFRNGGYETAFISAVSELLQTYAQQRVQYEQLLETEPYCPFSSQLPF